jgi:phage-related minor tail protein
MAEANLNIKVKLDNQVSGEMSKIKQGFGGLKNIGQDWVALTAKVYLFTNAVKQLSRFMSGFINEATRNEDAMLRLRNALQLNGEQVDRVSKKYAKFADEIQRTTRYSNDEILELMQQLISVGGVAEAEMERAAKVAMDFASATGRDLSTAGLTVAKAMGGFTGELGRLNIHLDENIPKSQKAIAALEAMEKKFGGMAQGDIGTYS